MNLINKNTMKKTASITIILIILINSFSLKAQNDTLEIYVDNSVRLSLIVSNAKKISELKQVDSLFRVFETDFMTVKDTFFVADKKNIIFYKQKKEFKNKKQEFFYQDKMSSLTIRYLPIDTKKCFIDNGNLISSDEFLHSATIIIDSENKLIFNFNKIEDFKYLKTINLDNLIKDIDAENKDYKLRKNQSDFCRYMIKNNKISEKSILKGRNKMVIQLPAPSFGLYALNGELVPNINFNLEFLTVNQGRGDARHYGIKYNSFFYFDRSRREMEIYPYLGVYYGHRHTKMLKYTTISLSYSLSNNDNIFSQSNFLEKNTIFMNTSTSVTKNISINYSMIFKFTLKEQPVNQNTTSNIPMYFGIGVRYSIF